MRLRKAGGVEDRQTPREEILFAFKRMNVLQKALLSWSFCPDHAIEVYMSKL